MKKLILNLLMVWFIIPVFAQTPLNENLLQAVKHNNIDSVKYWVEHGADVNYADTSKATVLMWAAYKGNLDIVKYLVKNGADATRKGIIHLEGDGFYGNLTGIAAGSGNLEMLKYFIEECGIDINDKEINRAGETRGSALNALSWALSQNQEKIIHYLLENGAYYCIHNNLYSIPEYRFLKEYLLKHPEEINQLNSDSVLVISRLIQKPEFEDAFTLLNAACDVNTPDKWGNTPLHYAVKMNSRAWVSGLIQYGANINVQNIYGKNPVFYALDFTRDEILRTLLKSNADINIRDKNGKPLLFYAIDKNNRSFIEHYITSGLSIEITDAARHTPLTWSLLLNNEDLAALFLKKGANLRAVDSVGETAIQIAFRRNLKNIMCQQILYDSNLSVTREIKADLYLPKVYTYIAPVDISADNKYLLALDSRSLVLFDIENNREIRRYTEPNHSIQHAGFLFNENIVYGFSSFGKIFLWDTFTEELIKKIDIDEISIKEIGRDFTFLGSQSIPMFLLNDQENILVSYGGKYTVSNDPYFHFSKSSSDIYLISLANETILRKLKSPDKEAVDLHQSNDSKWVMACFDSVITIYNYPDLQLIDQVNFDKQKISYARFLNNNTQIIIFTNDSTVRYYNLFTKSFERAHHLEGFVDKFYEPPSGDYSIIQERNRMQIVSKDFLPTFNFYVEGHFPSVVFSVNGDSVIYNDGFGIVICNTKTGRSSKLQLRDNDMFTDMGLSADTKALVIASFGPPFIWHLNSGKIHLNSTNKYYSTENIMMNDSDSTFITSGIGVDSAMIQKSVLIKWNGSQGYLLDTIFAVPTNYRYFKGTYMAKNDSLLIVSYNIGDGIDFSEAKIRVFNLKNKTRLTDLENLSENIYAFDISQDGKYLVICGGNKRRVSRFEDGTSRVHTDLILYDLQEKRVVYKIREAANWVDFLNDNKTFVTGFYSRDIQVWTTDSTKPVRKFSPLPGYTEVTSFDRTADEKYAITSSSNGNIYLWDFNTGIPIHTFKGHDNKVVKVIINKDGTKAFSYSIDNTICIWDIPGKSQLATLIPLKDGEWIVTAPNGLFDASPGAMKELYYVAGMETIDLEQLKHRYYQPGLLQILLGFSNEKLREVPPFDYVRLYPSKKLKIENDRLTIKLKNQGGGIGKVSVFIDNICIVDDARSARDSSKIELDVSLDLKQYSKYFNYDSANMIKVIAWNAEGYLTSRPDTISYKPKRNSGSMPESFESGKDKMTILQLYGLVIGTSDYAGDQIDLKYAAKDAEAFGNALNIGATRLFGKENVHIKVLSTGSSNEEPSNINILAHLGTLSSANPEDIIVIYLSGHGVNFGGQDGLFYYLTMEANEADAGYLKDPAVRKYKTLSSQDIATCLNQIPARKKVVIIDACSSGQAADNLLASLTKDIPSSQKRALEFTQDATGSFIIASSATNTVSYESSRFGHGLLTYALLKGMRGAKLEKIEESDFIDVEQLFQYVKTEVPLLARDISGIQEPLVKTPGTSGRLILGQMTEEDKKMLDIEEPKAIFLPCQFTNDDIEGNELDIDEKLNIKLDQISAKNSTTDIQFMRNGNSPDAFVIKGKYILKNNSIEISYILKKGTTIVRKTEKLAGKHKDIDELINQIIRQSIEKALITNY